MISGLFGVTEVVMDSDQVPPGDPQIIGVDESRGLSVLRVRRALPRAYAVHRGIPVRDEEEALDQIAAPDFKPGREVILEGPGLDPSISDRGDDAALQIPLVRGRLNDSVGLRVNMPWPGFVVLNEAAFIGWTVAVDGVERPLLIANGIVRAVEVPAGEHRVLFKYRTPGLRVGVVTTLLTLLALGLWVAVLSGRALPARKPGVN